jgi:nucleotide-binding universal stress UspA family protein
MKKTTDRLIVCGTDFSENSAEGIAAAAAVAGRFHKPLKLLHVADQFNIHCDTKAEATRYLQPAREKLKHEIESASSNLERVSGEVLHGQYAEDALVDFASKNPVDLLVVSAVSKTAFDRWTLGSVSEEISEAAPVPTLTVRSAKPFEAWARGERALRVFVAADFSPSSDAALHWVGKLREIGPCEVVLGHVNSPYREEKRLGLCDSQESNENQPTVQAILERDLREKASAIFEFESFEILVRASEGKADLQIVNLAIKNQADLLVVGTHQRQGLKRLANGSFSSGILRHAPMSVVCVPKALDPSPAVHPCRRVLVATDLKPSGAHALSYAYSVVGQDGTVCIAHVCKPSESTKRARQIAECTEQLRAQIPDAPSVSSVNSEIRVVENAHFVEAICQAAESFNADLVCIGAHTRPGAAARLTGSVALGVLQKCERPVLVVWPARDS